MIMSFFYTKIIPDVLFLFLGHILTRQTAEDFSALDGALETPGKGKSPSRLQTRPPSTPVPELRPRSLCIKTFRIQQRPRGGTSENLSRRFGTHWLDRGPPNAASIWFCVSQCCVCITDDFESHFNFYVCITVLYVDHSTVCATSALRQCDDPRDRVTVSSPSSLSKHVDGNRLKLEASVNTIRSVAPHFAAAFSGYDFSDASSLWRHSFWQNINTRQTLGGERECVRVYVRERAHVVPCPKITANQTFCSSSGRTGQSGGGPLVTEQLPWLMPVIWLWHPWRRRARLAGSAVVSDGTRRSGPPGRIRTAAKMPPTLFQKLFNKRSALSPPPLRCNREDPAFR